MYHSLRLPSSNCNSNLCTALNAYIFFSTRFQNDSMVYKVAFLTDKHGNLNQIRTKKSRNNKKSWINNIMIRVVRGTLTSNNDRAISLRFTQSSIQQQDNKQHHTHPHFSSICSRKKAHMYRYAGFVNLLLIQRSIT